jgi:hypothetical protein
MLKSAWRNLNGHVDKIQLHQTVPDSLKGKCDFLTAVHVHYHFDTKEKLRDDFFKAAAELLTPEGQMLLVGCPSDHIRETPDHYHNMVAISDIPQDIIERSSQISLLKDEDGYIRLDSLPKFDLKDGTQMKAVFRMIDMQGQARELSLTDTFWSDETLREMAKEAGLTLQTRVNLPLRGHPNAYMVMQFRKDPAGSMNGNTHPHP